MHLERLHILYEHLKHGKLGHKKFDFSDYNVGFTSPNTCGTVGCAIGECPVIWDEWSFRAGGMPLLDHLFTTTASGESWFGVTYDEYCHLFIPDNQVAYCFGGEDLGESATRYQVADNIKAFIDKRYIPSTEEQ